MTVNDLKFNASIKYLADKYLAVSFRKIENGVVDLVQFKSGAVMTPDNRVLTTEGWKWVGDLYEEQKKFCNLVVSLVLEKIMMYLLIIYEYLFRA